MWITSLGGVAAGLAAGAVNGLFGAGGGMVLVPLLGWLTQMEDDEIFVTLWESEVRKIGKGIPKVKQIQLATQRLAKEQEEANS